MVSIEAEHVIEAWHAMCSPVGASYKSPCLVSDVEKHDAPSQQFVHIASCGMQLQLLSHAVARWASLPQGLRSNARDLNHLW